MARLTLIMLVAVYAVIGIGAILFAKRALGERRGGRIAASAG
jgi:hypothetical protein